MSKKLYPFMQLIAAMFVTSGVCAQTPQLFQVTTAETRPGDAVLVRGEYLANIKSIQVSRLNDDAADPSAPAYIPQLHEDRAPDEGGTSRRAQAQTGVSVASVQKLLQNNQSVKFIIPNNWKQGVYSVKLVDGKGQANSFYVNQPKVVWAISEAGPRALAGDYLRIQGKNLLRQGGKAQVALQTESGKTAVKVDVAKFFDDYSVSVNIPASVAAGTYYLYYHNGFGGKTAWSEPLKIEVVKTQPEIFGKRTFSITDYGAKGDGQFDNTKAFQAAMEAAGKAGGGVVLVPAGRYLVSAEIDIPPHTLLKGESRKLSQVIWNSQVWPIGKLPNTLVAGTHHFGIMDLNIWASRAWGIIMTTGPEKEQGNVLLENITLRQSAEVSGKIYQKKINRDSVENEMDSRWQKTGIFITGPNVKVRNCDINTAGMINFHGVSGFIQNCQFTRRGTGVNQPYMLVHPKGLIMEDCLKQTDGYGYGGTIDESYNYYEARVTIPFNYTNDREAMTLDGGSGGYYGKISGISGKVIQLSSNSTRNQFTPDKWIGGGFYIIEGKGAGQFRRIASHTEETLTLDKPFLVDPDTSSVVSVTTVRQNFTYSNNTVTDAGAYQLYGTIQDVVISGIKMTRCNGIVSRGGLLYRGKQPDWYVDIVNCELGEGNYTHWFGNNDRHSGFSRINLMGNGNSGMNLGVLVRRNKLSEYSYIITSPGGNSSSVVDAIIEDNTFNIAQNAIELGGTGNQTAFTLIHNNHYNNVVKQVETKINKDAYLVLEDGVKK